MFKYFIIPFLLMASPAIAQDVSAKPAAKSETTVVVEDWNRKAMNKQVDETLFNVADHCSGTLISSKYRLILTNYHCVDDLFQEVEEEVVNPETGEIEKVTKRKMVPLNIFLTKDADTQTRYAAEVVGGDRELDIALVRVKSDDFPAKSEVKLASGNWCERGMPVWAVGNPIMLEGSVTKGIISYCTRELKDDMTASGNAEHLVQYDTPIAGGSSGGGLFNYKGEIVGITNSGFRATDMNFAVPISVAYGLLEKNCYASVYDPKKPDHAKCKGDATTAYKAKNSSYGSH